MRSAAPRLALLGLVILVTVTSAALAEDVIVFKNGRKLSGRIVQETKETVVIQIPGGGKATFSRAEIKEILRDVSPKEGEKEVVEAGVLRSEHYFVWSGKRRLGTRSLWVRKLEGGRLSLEEESRFLDDKGEVEVVARVTEIVSPSLEPQEIVYREISSRGKLTLSGAVRSGSLELDVSLPAGRRKSSLRLPDGCRFPLSAREFAIRERSRLKGAWVVPVFDPREENFYPYRFESAKGRSIDWEGARTEVTVLKRRRGERATEEIWIDPAGRTLTEELNGPEVVAVLSSRKRVQAHRDGAEVKPTSEEERVRPLYVHPEAGFQVRKPNIAWSFKERSGEDERVLEISNLRYFATVDIWCRKRRPEGGLLSTLAVQMEKEFAASARDFKKLSDGYFEVGGERAYKMIA
ncbi:MAG: hypothetical protein ACYTDY_20075, partial [Planctomycetota bacterium]